MTQHDKEDAIYEICDGDWTSGLIPLEWAAAILRDYAAEISEDAAATKQAVSLCNRLGALRTENAVRKLIAKLNRILDLGCSGLELYGRSGSH